MGSGGGVIASTTIFPGTGSYTTYQVPITFPSAGDYTLRFTEVGDDDSLGPIIDNVSLLVCFAAGTRITTPRGHVPIEDLKVGDRVTTTDGPQTLHWIGTRTVSCNEMAENDRLRPVRIEAGALGEALPKRDLWVSRQHRMITRSAVAERMFGVFEALVPAIKLTALPGIAVDRSISQITYHHLLFDAHRIVFAEGAPSESMLTGKHALDAVSAEAAAELALMFPDMVCETVPEPRVPTLSGKRAQSYLARLSKNNKALLS